MVTHHSENIEAFSLRLPTDLRERIRKSAIAHRRSLNAEMLVLMEKALPAEAEAEAKEGQAA